MTDVQKEKRRADRLKFHANNPDAAKRYRAKYYQKLRDEGVLAEKRRQDRERFIEKNPGYDTKYRRGWVAANVKKAMIHAAKSRALKNGVVFDVSEDDFEIPDLCPVLGIPLVRTGGARTDNSPSLDRIDNTKGYIKGNVCVISWRANQLKSDGTADEHQRICDYMKKYLD